jgi:osmotically inducible protein OsmC
MAEFRRKASAVWNGDLKGGKGTMSAHSGVLKDVPYSFTKRFGDEPGTNPEELLAAALASCYSMALSNVLSTKGHTVESIDSEATCFFTSKPEGGFHVTRMLLKVSGRVAGIDQATFAAVAKDVEANSCPMSVLLRGCVPIEVDATLVK